MIAFGALTTSSAGVNAGFWYRGSNIPDATVELRVYAPCYDDRVREKVMTSNREVLRLHGYSIRGHLYVEIMRRVSGQEVALDACRRPSENEATREREPFAGANFYVLRGLCH
jgi:hypothetical protein